MDDHGCASGLLGAHGDVTSVASHRAEGDAKTDPFGFRFRRVKRIEAVLTRLGGHAAAIVFDGDH